MVYNLPIVNASLPPTNLLVVTLLIEDILDVVFAVSVSRIVALKVVDGWISTLGHFLRAIMSS